MDFRLPELGEGVYEAEVVRWLVKPGDTVKRAQVLLEVLTDKATMEVPSPFAGVIDALAAEPGDQVKVGQVIFNYHTDDHVDTEYVEAKEASPAPIREAKSPATAAAAHNGPSATAMEVRAAPSVRLLARKLGVDLGNLTGSGPHGRILVQDLQRFVHPAQAAPTTAVSPADYGKPGTRVKLQGLRRKIAEHMALSKKVIPHYTYVDECDVSELVRLRESLKEPLAAKGVRLTYLAFFVKAVVRALREVPIVNASLDEEAGEIVLHNRCHIGIAVATTTGLIVPVIHDADKLDLAGIAREIERLSLDARQNRNKLDDLRGGTFSITSIGNLGGLFATPIIPHPQVGILGVGKISKRPVFDEHDQVRPAHLLYLSLSFDHRVLDGAVGTAFGNTLIRHLLNPASLLLDL